MQLTLQTDYALRILMALAAAEGQLSVEEIARGYGISRNHLAKIAQRLQALGYITALRGRGGGLRLAQAPDTINLGRLVRAFESLDNFIDCLDRADGNCAVNGVCGLRGVLSLALNDFLKRLDGYSLAQLLPDPAKFTQRLLSHPAP